MSLAEYFRELTLPLRSLPVTMLAGVILLLLGLIAMVARLNSWLAIGLTLGFGLAVLPGLSRYLMQIAEWRAAGKRVEPPGPDMIGLQGPVWPLWMPGVFAACLAGDYWLGREIGLAGPVIITAVFSALYPAAIGVLAITHSIAAAADPRALLQLIRQVGAGYGYASITAFALWVLPARVAGYSRPFAAIVFVYLLFALFAVGGNVLRKRRLIDAVAIPEPDEPGPEQQLADLRRHREAVLTHAYGFASRGNRAGALRHIDDWLQRDANPDDAWAWFLQQMLGWEQSDHALFFAQSYIARLLALGEEVQAIKVVLRCRLVDERFRPRPDDLDLTIAAAQATGNEALAEALRRA